MKDKLNVAVVGAGLFGQVHLRAYTQNPRVTLKMVCDVSDKNLKAAKKTYGAPVCKDLHAVASDPEIDAVSVATPDFLHREIVVALLKAGKSVLVEKPLATTVADARAMVKAARDAGTTLMIDFHNRFNPPFAEAQRRVASGEFGAPVMASGRQANPLFVPLKMLSWAGKSGPHWFLFPHLIDVIGWMLGRRAVKVTAIGHRGILKSMGVDTYDSIQALLQYKDCSAMVETCWIIPDTMPNLVDFSVTLFGSKQRIGITPLGPTMSVAGQKKFEHPIVGPLTEQLGMYGGWMYSPINHFVGSLLAGKQPICTAEDGFHNTAVICAIEKSIKSGQTVEVEEL
jgi:predicted dehydrogenase